MEEFRGKLEALLKKEQELKKATLATREEIEKLQLSSVREAVRHSF